MVFHNIFTIHHRDSTMIKLEELINRSEYGTIVHRKAKTL